MNSDQILMVAPSTTSDGATTQVMKKLKSSNHATLVDEPVQMIFTPSALLSVRVSFISVHTFVNYISGLKVNQ